MIVRLVLWDLADSKTTVAELHSPDCAKCGSTPDLTADHIVPLARGGHPLARSGSSAEAATHAAAEGPRSRAFDRQPSTGQINTPSR